MLRSRFSTRAGRADHPETNVTGSPASRRASTLTEVLVALMVTSIGLVSVATLFPLSVLRSVKATQVTAATECRYNAEVAIDMYPRMITNPVNVAWNAINGGTPAVWDPPAGFQSLAATPNYVIDPLGFAAVQGLGLTIGAGNFAWQKHPEHWYGNDLNGGVAPPSTSVPWVDANNGLFGIARYPGTWRTMAAADHLVTLPDSWPLQYDTVGGTLAADPGAAAGLGPTQITLPGLNFSSPLGGTNPSVRIVMFSTDGVSCQIRYVTAFQGTTVLWTEDTNSNGVLDPGEDLNGNGNLDHYPLPASFVNLGVGIIRIELQERRYTWLLTVRQSNPQTTPPSANVDCVVFFKRSMENIGVDEALYQAVFTIGSTQVPVTYPLGVNPATNLPLKPFMKRGGFVFDANNAFWYRISNVVEPPIYVPNPPPPAGMGAALLVLDFPANASSNPNNDQRVLQRAMFPRGVVDVYPLGTKSYPSLDFNFK